MKTKCVFSRQNPIINQSWCKFIYWKLKHEWECVLYVSFSCDTENICVFLNYLLPHVSVVYNASVCPGMIPETERELMTSLNHPPLLAASHFSAFPGFAYSEHVIIYIIAKVQFISLSLLLLLLLLLLHEVLQLGPVCLLGMIVGKKINEEIIQEVLGRWCVALWWQCDFTVAGCRKVKAEPHWNGE